jgi:hypothetical protein
LLYDLGHFSREVPEIFLDLFSGVFNRYDSVFAMLKGTIHAGST